MRTLILLLGIPLWGGATLTISSGSLNPDGQTVALTMSGSSLSPASGITGCFAAHTGNSNSNVVGAASTSGDIVTFQLAAPALAGATVTVDIATAPGCPLVSGGDTPLGQSGFNVTNSSEVLAIGSAAFTNFARFDGGPLLNTDSYGLGYQNLAEWNSADGGFTVNATGTCLMVWQFDYNNGYSLEQDNTPIGTRVKKGANTSFSWATLATGLTGTHQYRLILSAGQASYKTSIIAMVRFCGGGPAGTKPAALKTIGACGDSIVGYYLDDSTLVDWWLNSKAAGTAAQIFSGSGQPVSPYLRDTCASHLTLFNNSAPDVCVLTGGVNDMIFSNPIGNPATAGTFIGDYVTMILSTVTQTPCPNLYVREILPTAYTNSANRSTYGAAQKTAVDYANANFGTHVCYYNTDSWLDPYTDTFDLLHPKDTGYSKIAGRQIGILAAGLDGSSFTVTGPSGGVVSVDSADFTVTLRNGGKWNGETVILNDNNGGLFTPSIGSAGTGPLSVTAPTGVTAWSYKYRPASVGSKTLAYSGLADCWKAPTSTGYTATSGGGGTTSIPFSIPFSVTVPGSTPPYPATISGTMTGTVVITN